jgi:hypothetical protein
MGTYCHVNGTVAPPKGPADGRGHRKRGGADAEARSILSAHPARVGVPDQSLPVSRVVLGSAANPSARRHRPFAHRPANGSSWHLRRVDQDREDDPFEPADCRFAGQSRPSRAIHKNAAVGKVLLILDVSLSASILAKRTLSKPCSTIVEYVPRVAAQFRNLQAA